MVPDPEFPFRIIATKKVRQFNAFGSDPFRQLIQRKSSSIGAYWKLFMALLRGSGGIAQAKNA